MRLSDLHLRRGLGGSASAWRSGAAAAGGPLVVLLAVFGTALGGVGVARLLVEAPLFAWPTLGWAVAITVLVGPWFVARGWVNRDRG